MGWSIVNTSGAACGLSTFYRFTVQQALGAGMPPVSNITTEYGLLDGTLFQRARAEERTFTLVGTLSGSDVQDLHHRRRVIIDAVKPDRTSPQQPVVFRYDGGGTTVQASAYYAGGLELGNVAAVHEANVGLQFTMADPYWESVTSTACNLTITDETNTINRLIYRSACGEWESMGTGVDGLVETVVHDSASIVYAGGAFDTAGSSVASYVAQWDGTYWGPMGNGMNNTVSKMAVAANNDVYAVGPFSMAGAVAACRIAVWNGSAWAAVGGASPNSTINTVTVGPDGNVYIGGDFTTLNGSTVNKIAYYNNGASAWKPVSASGANDDVLTLFFPQGNLLYVGGLFTSIGGITASRIATYNISSSAWSALGTGLNASPATMTLFQGELYVGGDFITAGGKAASHIARWNGADWFALGEGTTNGTNQKVWTLGTDSLDNLYAGGTFTRAGNLSNLPDRNADWNGTTWFESGVDFPGGATFYDIDVDGDTLYVAVNTSGDSASVSGLTTSTNNGTSRTYPVFAFTGPGIIYSLTNFTSGKIIYFDINLNTGEVVTLDLRPGAKTFVSNFRGNVISTILPGSDLTTFALEPGTNSVAVNARVSSGTITWTDRYWSLDAGA